MKKILLISIQLIVSLLIGLFLGNFIVPLNQRKEINTLKGIDSLKETFSKNNSKNYLNSEKSQEIFSPYTGSLLDSESIDNIPFICIVENSRDARPQSGLSQADLVYETMAEGGIPRFLALFHKSSPEVIGPVRSVRPYFLNISKEHSLPFAHCGGSQEALLAISTDDSLNSINEIKNGTAFWRDKTRKAPHNLYTSADNIRNFIKDNSLQYSKENNLKFEDTALLNSNNYSSNINLKLSNYYNTSYKYIDGFYEKYMDGKLSIDKNTGETLKFKNIIIQITNMSLQSDNVHIDVDLVGEGEGYLLTNGKIEKINWRKDNLNSKTTLTFEDNSLVTLSSGNTIWHIVDPNSKLNFN